VWKNNAFCVKKLCHHHLPWWCFSLKILWCRQVFLISKHLTAVLILGHNIVPKVPHRWIWSVKCPGLFNKGCISLADVHTLSFLLITDVTSNPPCARETHPWFYCNYIMASRPVARQWPQNKQLRDSHCCITALQANMFPRHLKNTAIMEETFFFAVQVEMIWAGPVSCYQRKGNVCIGSRYQALMCICNSELESIVIPCISVQ
jgi:hypothetical protein